MNTNKNFRSIRLKLVWLLSFSAAIAILISSSVLFWYSYEQNKLRKFDLLHQVALITKENLLASLEFDDALSAVSILSTCASSDMIDGVYLVKKDKSLFASYIRTVHEKKLLDQFLSQNDISNQIQYIDFSSTIINFPILLKDKQIASLIIIANNNKIHQIIMTQFLIQLLTFVAVLLIIVLLAFRLQKIFTFPIFSLKNAMDEVRVKNNYDVSIKEENNDEFQSLFDGFHQMLETIKRQKNELENYAENLNETIKLKTHDIEEQRSQLERMVTLFDKNIITSETDEHGIITYASEAFCAISGYTKDELLGKPHSIVRHSDMPKEVFADLWQTIQSNKVWKGEVKNRKKDGTFYWVDVTITPKCDSNGENCGYTAIRHDITAQKEVEALSSSLEQKVEERTIQLKQNQEQMAFVSQYANLGFWTFNPQVGDLLVNDIFVQMLGYDANEVLEDGHDTEMFKPFKDGLAFWERLLHPDDAARTAEVITAHINGETDLYKVEYRMRKADGTWMWSMAIGRIAEHDKDGNAIRFNGVNIDIQDAKDAQIKIEESRVFLNTLLDSQEQIIVTTNGKTIISANKAFLDFYSVDSIDRFKSNYNAECICNTFNKEAPSGYLQIMMGDETWIDYIIARSHTNITHKAMITENNINNIFSVTAAILPGDKGLKSAIFTNITEIEEAKQQIEAIHKHTQESIEYASLIQGALIPDEQIFEHFFQEHFTIWQPKDIVGGDIYLMHKLNDYEVILMVIDCTGHGVPGAFVTMLVKAIERQIMSNIHKDKIISPAKILSIFNKSIKHLLKQESIDSVSNAGFDGGIIYYNKQEKIVKFAGAEIGLFYMEDEELKTIKGSRHSIGYKKSDANFEFSEHTIKAKEGMKFYISTDGYFDQNGGEKGFPFNKKKFTELIENSSHKLFKEQKVIFSETLSNYQGEEERNDDVTVIGFKI